MARRKKTEAVAGSSLTIDPNSAKGKVLTVLSHNGGKLSGSELRSRLHMGHGSLGRTLDELHRDGYVARVAGWPLQYALTSVVGVLAA